MLGPYRFRFMVYTCVFYRRPGLILPAFISNAI